ncbi:MAG: hypothetical protein AAFN27_17855 [Pseudomonadota bacterium]
MPFDGPITKAQPTKALPTLKSKGIAKMKPLPGQTKEERWANEMAYARLSILYLFSNATVNESLVSVALEGAGKLIGGGIGIGGAVAKQTGNVGGQIAAKGGKLYTDIAAYGSTEIVKVYEDKIPETKAKMGLAGKQLEDAKEVDSVLLKVGQAVGKKISEKLDLGKEGLPNWIKILKKMVGFFSGLIVSQAGIIKDIMKFGKGVWKVGESAIHAYDRWQANKTVNWNSGHTKVILNAIDVAMAQNAGEGLWHILSSAGTATATMLGGIGGAVAKLVLGFVECVTKFIFRMVETLRIKKFIKECKDHWKAASSAKDAIHFDEKRFTKWWSSYACHSPVLACVALNSGFCGTTHHFVNLFGPGDPAAQYAAGKKYLDSIKDRAVGYQKDSGFFFTSNNAQAMAAFKRAKDYNKAHAKNNPGAYKLAWIKALFAG